MLTARDVDSRTGARCSAGAACPSRQRLQRHKQGTGNYSLLLYLS
jgi:hypothetical protein